MVPEPVDERHDDAVAVTVTSTRNRAVARSIAPDYNNRTATLLASLRGGEPLGI
jgi:hypothetical protein